jgi:2-amino-4-hydroxy-6-hydroxymethyldihydropteridine diphosphokinase
MVPAEPKRAPRPWAILGPTGWSGFLRLFRDLFFAWLCTFVFLINLNATYIACPMNATPSTPIPWPLRFTLIITGLGGVWFWARVVRQLRNAFQARTRARRAQSRRCIHCGYDLRASQGKCPECGATAPTIAYIALGSNLGDRELSLKRALDLLALIQGIKVTAVSSFLENPAVGGPPDSPPFLNAAAEIETSLAPDELLAALLETERKMGRVRRERWGPRLIDLDVLFYGDESIAREDLTIPHPRLQERRFVLEPLAQIAPEFEHPVLKKTISQLLAELG